MRFFLRPDELLRLRIAGEHPLQLLHRPRVQLFDADDGDVIQFAERDLLDLFALRFLGVPVGAGLVQIVVDLARAEDHAGDGLLGLVGQHLVEAPRDQFFHRGGTGAGVGLRGHQDQRLAEVALHLPAQGVEVLGRRREVADLDIVLGAQLQIAFDAGRGVLRPLPFVAVREEHHQAAAAVPLRFAGRDELIDDDLGAVGEVAELGLPEHEGLWVVEGVTVLEPEHRRFAEEAVEDVERGGREGEVGQRAEGLAVVGIVVVGVAVAERRPPAVLPAQANGMIFEHERTERQRLGGAPIDLAAGFDFVAPFVRAVPARVTELVLPFDFDLVLQVLVQGEAFGQVHQLIGDLVEHIPGDPGLAGGVRVHVGHPFPPATEGWHELDQVVGLLVGFLHLLGLLQRRFQFAVALQILLGSVRDRRALEQVIDLRQFVVGGQSVRDELAGVNRHDRVLLAVLVLDLAVLDRLCHRGVVVFVVAHLAVANQVDDDIALEGLPVFDGQLRDGDTSVRVLGVHVEDRRLDELRDVGAILGAAGIAGLRREADLVVDDDVQRAADAVAVQVGHAQSFGHHALPGERRVAVEHQRHAARAVFVFVQSLLGPHAPRDHGVDRFEVRRIRREREVDREAVFGGDVRRVAHVVLDVAVGFDRVRVVRVEELDEQLFEGLLQNVGEHVQPAAVGHADDEFEHPEFPPGLDDRVHHRDERLAPFEAEALFAEELHLQEVFELLRAPQQIQGAQPLHRREVRLVMIRLDPFGEPLPRREVLDVHVLDADRSAVGLLQRFDERAERFGPGDAEEHRRVDLPGGILAAQGEAIVVEFPRRRRRLGVQRVRVGDEVSGHAVRVDESHRRRLQTRIDG